MYVGDEIEKIPYSERGFYYGGFQNLKIFPYPWGGGQNGLNPVLRDGFFHKNRFSGVFAEILTYIVGDL